MAHSMSGSSNHSHVLAEQQQLQNSNIPVNNSTASALPPGHVSYSVHPAAPPAGMSHHAPPPQQPPTQQQQQQSAVGASLANQQLPTASASNYSTALNSSQHFILSSSSEPPPAGGGGRLGGGGGQGGIQMDAPSTYMFTNGQQAFMMSSIRPPFNSMPMYPPPYLTAYPPQPMTYVPHNSLIAAPPFVHFGLPANGGEVIYDHAVSGMFENHGSAFSLPADNHVLPSSASSSNPTTSSAASIAGATTSGVHVLLNAQTLGGGGGAAPQPSEVKLGHMPPSFGMSAFQPISYVPPTNHLPLHPLAAGSQPSGIGPATQLGGLDPNLFNTSSAAQFTSQSSSSNGPPGRFTESRNSQTMGSSVNSTSQSQSTATYVTPLSTFTNASPLVSDTVYFSPIFPTNVGPHMGLPYPPPPTMLGGNTASFLNPMGLPIVTASAGQSVHAAPSSPVGGHRRRTNSSGFEEPEILTAKKDCDDAHSMYVDDYDEEESEHIAVPATAAANLDAKHNKTDNVIAVGEETACNGAIQGAGATSTAAAATTSKDDKVTTEVNLDNLTLQEILGDDKLLSKLSDDKLPQFLLYREALINLLNEPKSPSQQQPQHYPQHQLHSLDSPYENGTEQLKQQQPPQLLYPISMPAYYPRLSPIAYMCGTSLPNHSSASPMTPILQGGVFPFFATPPNAATAGEMGYSPSPGSGAGSHHMPPLLHSPLFPRSEHHHSNEDNNRQLYQKNSSSELDEDSQKDVGGGGGGGPLDSTGPNTGEQNTTAEVSSVGGKKVGRFQIHTVAAVPSENSGKSQLEERRRSDTKLSNSTPLTSPKTLLGDSQQQQQQQQTLHSLDGTAIDPLITEGGGGAGTASLKQNSQLSSSTHNPPPVSRFRKARIEECWEAWEQNGISLRDWRSKNPDSNLIHLARNSLAEADTMDAKMDCLLCPNDNKLDNQWHCQHKSDFKPHLDVNLLPKANFWSHGQRHDLPPSGLSAYMLSPYDLHHPLVEAHVPSLCDLEALRCRGMLRTEEYLPTVPDKNNGCGEMNVNAAVGCSPFIAHAFTASHKQRCKQHNQHHSRQTVSGAEPSTAALIASVQKYHNEFGLGHCDNDSGPLTQEASGRGASSGSGAGTTTAAATAPSSSSGGSYAGISSLCAAERPNYLSTAQMNCLLSNADWNNGSGSQSGGRWDNPPPPGSPSSQVQSLDFPSKEIVNPLKASPIHSAVMDDKALLLGSVTDSAPLSVADPIHNREDSLQSLSLTDSGNTQSKTNASTEEMDKYWTPVAMSSQSAQHDSTTTRLILSNTNGSNPMNTGTGNNNDEAAYYALQRLNGRISQSLDSVKNSLLDVFRTELENASAHISLLLEQNAFLQRQWEHLYLTLQHHVPAEVWTKAVMGNGFSNDNNHVGSAAAAAAYPPSHAAAAAALPASHIVHPNASSATAAVRWYIDPPYNHHPHPPPHHHHQSNGNYLIAPVASSAYQSQLTSGGLVYVPSEYHLPNNNNNNSAASSSSLAGRPT